MNIVQVESVSKIYSLGEQQVHALKAVTLSVSNGAFLAIAGPSGSGKSTLLNLIGCIDTPSSGRILIDGQDVSGQPPDQLAELRARTIGFIFQTFNLFPVLSARENVEYPLLRRRDVSVEERRARVQQFLEIVGLAGFADHRPNQLSGGQRQRVAIARALATQPKIVLADEPTANLDHNTGNGILQLMQQINRDFKTTFIFSTHDQRVMTMADKLVRIEDGELADNPSASSRLPVAKAQGEQGHRTPVDPDIAGLSTAALRERVNAFLYIERSDIYMRAPWHINTDSAIWVVSRSSIEVGHAQDYIRRQLDANEPFHAEFARLIAAARRRGIEVQGWPD